MKIRYKFLTLILSISLISSCDNYLNVPHKGKVDAESISEGINNLELILAGLYSNALSTGFQKCMYVFGEATADNMYLMSTDPVSEDVQLCTFRYTPRNYLLENMWGFCYQGINKANRTIENADIMFDPWYDYVTTQVNTEHSQLYKDNAERFQHIVGEAKFWRAFYYFYLVRTFGDVPIQNEIQYVNSEGDNFWTPRISRLEVYDYIEKDLREAILCCRKNYDAHDPAQAYNAGRITRGAATGLLIKVLGYRASIDQTRAESIWNEVLDLSNWMANLNDATEPVDYENRQILEPTASYHTNDYYEGMSWEEISKELFVSLHPDHGNGETEVMYAPNQYQLLPYYDMLFRVESEYCCESVFEINHNYAGYGVTTNVGTSVWGQLSNIETSGVGGGSKYMKPSLVLANYKQDLSPKDPRHLFCLPSGYSQITHDYQFGNESSNNPGNSNSGKYLIWPEHVSPTGGDNDTWNNRNIVVLRYAEILLWQAEALNELNQSDKAVNVINKLRARASVSKGGVGELPQENATLYPKSGKPFPYRLLYLQDWENREPIPPRPVQDQDKVREYIWYERDVELLHEWDRFYDLVRTKQIYQALKDYNQAETYSEFRYKLFIKDKHELFAIPQEEIIKSNGKWKQNPGH